MSEPRADARGQRPAPSASAAWSRSRTSSFSIRAGEILGLIGPNGSGKSTAMKPIMGVERPDCRVGPARRRGDRGLAAHRVARLRRRPGVPAFAPAAPADGAREHQARAAARQADAVCFADAEVDARGARHRRAGRAGQRDGPASADPALRRPAPAGARQGDRAPSEAGAGRRAVRRTDGARGRAFSELIREFRDDGRAVLLVDHNVKSVAALVDRVLPCIWASGSPKARPPR